MKYLKKLVDFFKSVKPVLKKDKNLLKSRRQYRPGRWYAYDTNLLRIERCSPTYFFNGRNNAISSLPSAESRVRDMSNLLLWKNNNQDKVLLYNLGTNIISHIDEKIFLNDILPICANKHLVVIAIDFTSPLVTNGIQVVKLLLRERDFQDGDGLPTDMLEYYISYLRSEVGNLRKKYFNEYNFSKDDRLYTHGNAGVINVHGVIEFKIEIGL